MTRLPLTSILTLGVSAVALTTAAQAQVIDDDDVIVVTATKRAQTLQEVPFSVDAQTQEDIQRTGSQTLEDIARNVASLNIQNLGPGQSQVSVRGVSAGQIVRDQPGVKEQVGVYLDESVISLSLFTPDLDLFDLNRVETLRGPQGTLFGSGSIGGTLRYITNQPNPDAFEAMVEADVNTISDGGTGGSLKGVVNVPLSDSAAFRLVAYHTEYAGFIDALREDPTAAEGFRIDEDVNSGDRQGIRASLMFQPTENLKITPRIIFQEIDVDGFNRQEEFNLFGNPFTTTRTPVTFEERQQYLLRDERFFDETIIGDVTLEYNTGPAVITSITSVMEREILVSRDASALTGSVSVDLGYPDEAVLIPSNLRDTTDLSSFTQEVRIANSGASQVDWLLGAFYSKIERDYAQRLPTRGYDGFTDDVLGAGTSDAVRNGFGADSPFNSDLFYDLTQYAVFGEATVNVNDDFRVTAGGRYYDFEEDREITSGGLFANGDSMVMDSTTSDGFNGRLIAAYDLTGNTTVNAQISQGFRLGGVNDPLNVPLCSAEDEAVFGGFQAYDDETLINYEAGIKSNFRGITFNAAAFYTDISDLQVTLDAGSCSSRIVFNVPEAHTTGIEAEVAIEPIEGLDISFAGSFINAELDSTVALGDGTPIPGLFEGAELPSAPQVQAAIVASYEYPLDSFRPGWSAVFNGSVQYVDEQFTQPGDQDPIIQPFASGLPFGGASGNDVTALDLQLPDYTIANFSWGLMNEDGFEALLYINNAFDENALLSFDRERGGRARLAYRTNQPRTIGLTLRKRY
ncbi:TonB-dependent receptor [Parvularcula sp. ZS-1/3]|uniref:TonB-dependent receptor n=1 Tax=Parvularcula mediterranea TaxID=2732508 RepID=A0A7Y3RMM6_9PROT|nr:TonB-dependent receptor [Parvularcula mediterranea]NNU16891.1 TonB-dependent receptor [Parvularcula mediterranea]